MIEGTDFSLPDGDSELVPEPGSPHDLGSQAPSPVIVIEYRNRGLASRLMPPALILVAALAISSYQRKTPVWPIAPTTPRQVQVAATTPPEVPKPVETVAHIEPDPKSTPLSPPSAAEPPPPEPTGARQPSPFDLDTTDLKPVSPEPRDSVVERSDAPPRVAANPLVGDVLPEAAPIPAAEPEPSREEILRDIEREADQSDAKRQDLEGLKNRAKSLLMNEAISRIQAERTSFHEDLKQLLARFGRQSEAAGKEIDQLCLRYGKEPLPEVKAAYKAALRVAPKRWPRPAQVETMRSIGVPEALILDQICHEFDKLLNTRGGPRSEDEVRVRAARALLAIPLTSPGKKPAAAAGFVRGVGNRP